MIDIVSIGNQKVSYCDHQDIKFESLTFYLNLAQKTIAKFSKNMASNLSNEMLKSEDAIANVANCIMMADWRWDKNRVGNTGHSKTKYSYRNQCAIWAIKSYITRKNKTTRLKTVDNVKSYNNDNLNVLDIIKDSSSKSPLDLIIEKEDKDTVQKYINNILDENNELLSDRQKECLRLYYINDMTFAQIGKMFNITREAVRQNIKKAISKIQNVINV